MGPSPTRRARFSETMSPYSAHVVTRMIGIWTGAGAISTEPLVPDGRPHAHAHLHREHVAAGPGLEPQQPAVEVVQHAVLLDVHAEPALRALGHAAVEALREEPREHGTQLAVE